MRRLEHLTIEELKEGQDRIVHLRGSADILSLQSVQELLDRCNKEQVRCLFIDLSATRFINSPVWAVITLYARKQKSRVAVIGMTERIRGSFAMMGLHKELYAFSDLEVARRELGIKQDS
ncbi:MAG: STAS domain-containing protein [Verrucomicrobia bacterium]|nr:STAS domain-containing protein [Verrucomicrobiota bacterium]MBV9674104.1 STAS domain-containing protein [Verrucomicrobiota bacterium]